MGHVAREVIQGLNVQGEDESIRWKIDMSDLATPDGLASISTVVYRDREVLDDVSSTVLGTSDHEIVDTAIIKLPELENLTLGELYRVETVFTGTDGNTYERFFRVECTP